MSLNDVNNSLPYVVLLGSSKSINNLSSSELELINAAKAKIALNKFGAFYELTKITLTHIFFFDDYDHSSILFLKYIFKKLKKNKTKNLTFIISKRYKGYVYNSSFKYIIYKTLRFSVYYLKKIILKGNALVIKKISQSCFNYLQNLLSNPLDRLKLLRFSVLPKKSKIHYIDIQNWDKRGNFWAKTMNQKLFHYRGSFTSVLNYISIKYPNHDVFLAGVDFNSFGYFFSEKALSELPFSTNDWTTGISKNNNKHFSIIDYNGTKMDDELPFIINELSKTGNKMYSLSKKSYLVENGFVEYIKI